MRYLIYVCIGGIVFCSYIAILIVLITNGKLTEALILVTIWGVTIIAGLYSLRYSITNSSDRPKLNELGLSNSLVVIRTLFIIFIIVAIMITIIIILRVIF